MKHYSDTISPANCGLIQRSQSDTVGRTRRDTPGHISDRASASLAVSGMHLSPASHWRIVRSLAWQRRAASACVMPAAPIKSRSSCGDIGCRSQDKRGPFGPRFGWFGMSISQQDARGVGRIPRVIGSLVAAIGIREQIDQPSRPALAVDGDMARLDPLLGKPMIQRAVEHAAGRLRVAARLKVGKRDPRDWLCIAVGVLHWDQHFDAPAHLPRGPGGYKRCIHESEYRRIAPKCKNYFVSASTALDAVTS